MKRLPRRALPFLLAASALLPAAAGAAHRAVCVGVNRYDRSFLSASLWLKGCISDATRLRAHLVERGEWTPEGATLLLDDDATKAAIRAAITNAAAETEPGDVFVYTHSSHGYGRKDETGAFTVDTGLFAYDAEYADHELAADLARFPSGAKVVVFVDACNSGGLFKSVRGARAPSAEDGATAAVPFDLGARVGAAIDAIRAAEPVRRGLAPRGIASSEIGWITAADYDQYSFDAEDGSGGEFTTAALQGWTTGLCDTAPYGDEDGHASFYELWNYAKDVATGHGPPGDENHTAAQCLNADVLRAVRAGWVGVAPSWAPVAAPPAQAGRPYRLDLAPWLDGRPAPALSVTDGDGAATVDGTTLAFTPTETGRLSFTVLATNDAGSASATFDVEVGALAPKKFAVCVGIDRYAEISSLFGCANDARFMAANLAARGGWAPADVRVLTDAAATKAAIRSAISNAAAQAMAGDTFVYQHASHGGQTYARGDEILHGDDGMAVFLCVHDQISDDLSTAYNDWEIAADLGAFPSGVKAVALIDACNSGGLFKDAGEARASAAAFDLAGRVSARLAAVRARRRSRGGSAAPSIAPDEIGWATAADFDEWSLEGGFYHTDAWMTDPAYGAEYWDDSTLEYRLPSSYREGGVFLASATWGWWGGSADADPDAGDGDGLCDAYEFWKKGRDFCSTVGDVLAGDPGYNFFPQCTNVAVLRSVELGWCGPSSEPFPAVAPGAAAEDLAARLAGSADRGLVEHVRDEATYGAFRAWAASVKDASGAAPAGTEAVLQSPLAWLAFAIGSDRLPDPANLGVWIASFVPVGGTGAFALEVALDGASVAADADPARLAETFVPYASESLAGNKARFSPLGLTVGSVAPTNGGVRLVVAPPAGAGSQFFLMTVSP